MAALHRLTVPAPRAFGKRISAKLLFAVAGVLAVAVAAAQVNQFSRVTSAGYELDRLNQERATKQAENHEIAGDVARLSSLARVDIEARLRLKLVPAQSRLYLTVNHAVPDRQTVPTRFLPPERPAPPPSSAPWWKRLLRRAPFF
jgi:hypothetical protein